MIRISFLLFASLLLPFQSSAEEQGFIDFSDQVTPRCELAGLIAEPPEGWINVPIDTGIDQLVGCQMMLIENEALIGVLRVLSFDWTNAPADIPPWQQHVMAVESVFIEAMGYKIVEPVWRRDSVPITGPGFGNGRVMGFAVTIEGSEIPQESQMLVFDSGDNKYLINLLTPTKSVQGGVYYEKNLQGMAAIMHGFKVPRDAQR